MTREATKLILGRGEVFFDRFVDGTMLGEGERYLGNTTTFRIERTVERRERSRSYRGRKVDLKGSIVSESHAVDFTTDNIALENVAMWLGGSVSQTGAASGARFETLSVKHGLTYQIGSSIRPDGIRDIDYVTVRRNGNVVAAAGNYILSKPRGRIEIAAGAPDISDGAVIEVEFATRSTDAASIGSEPKTLHGALRFIAFNDHPSMPQIDYYFPYVRMTPKGQVDLKGDEWQQWSLDATAMNRSPNVQQMYVSTAGTGEGVGPTPDEQAIIDEFGNLEVFPFWEDLLQTVTNDDWPPAVDYQGI